jgi:uncharacterized protein YceH (UPF0502 family)
VEALTVEEVRVVACLIEKAATVPDLYPLTLNALRSACNQASGRAPVVAYDELTVQRALDGLKEKGLVRFVYASRGARSTKFRHIVDEALGVDPAALAVLGVLALRGPQTTNELRSRTERQHPFESVEAVEATLRSLAGRPEPLAVVLPRQPGRGQPRWAQLLAGSPDAAALVAAAANATTPDPRSPVDRVTELEAEVAGLAARLARLEAALGVDEEPDTPA